MLATGGAREPVYAHTPQLLLTNDLSVELDAQSPCGHTSSFPGLRLQLTLLALTHMSSHAEDHPTLIPFRRQPRTENASVDAVVPHSLDGNSFLQIHANRLSNLGFRISGLGSDVRRAPMGSHSTGRDYLWVAGARRLEGSARACVSERATSSACSMSRGEAGSNCRGRYHRVSGLF
jgi:hypothetical protein